MTDDAGPIKPRNKTSMIALAMGMLFLAMVLARADDTTSPALDALSKSGFATTKIVDVAGDVTREGSCGDGGLISRVTRSVPKGRGGEGTVMLDAMLTKNGWSYIGVPENGPVFATYSKTFSSGTAKEIIKESVEATLESYSDNAHVGGPRDIVELTFVVRCGD